MRQRPANGAGQIVLREMSKPTLRNVSSPLAPTMRFLASPNPAGRRLRVPP